MQNEVFRVSRKSRVLPVAALAGLVLTGCEHPDGRALLTATTVEVSRAVPSSGVTTRSTTTEPSTTTEQPTPPPEPQPTPQPNPRPQPSPQPQPHPEPPPRPQPQPPAPAKTDIEIAEARVFELTNAERATHGCPALAADDRLAAAARAHSADMAARDYFDHVSQDGRSFVDRVKAAGYPSPGAENIAAGQRTPEDVVKGWMDSPGHRANILNCGLKALGVGLARGGSYGRYWTQNFGW